MGRDRRCQDAHPHMNQTHCALKWIQINCPDPVLSPKKGSAKTPINIDILGGTVSGTNGTPHWDTLEPVPATNRPFSVQFRSVPCVPGTGGCSSLRRLSHKGRQKSVYVFFVYFFFRPPCTESQDPDSTPTPTSADFPSDSGWEE